MPPFHHHVRGQRDGITPLFLPAGAVGSALALRHVAVCVAQRSRRRHPEVTPTSPTTPQAPSCPEALSWPHAQAPMRGLCAGSRVSPSGPLRTTTPHGPHTRTAAPGGHLAAFLPASGLCVSGPGGVGQYQCQRPSQRRPLATAALHQLRWLFPRDPRHALAWQARGAREAGVGGGRAGGGLPTICQSEFVTLFTPAALPAHDASGLHHSTYDDAAWPPGYGGVGCQYGVRPGHAAVPSPATPHTRR